MSWLPLSFGAPMVLWGLIVLPIIWWLLRFTPPKPQTEVFPPLRILARVLKSDDTPNRSPWWLTLLRLVMAALVIFAIAEPVWNPRERIPVGGNLLALVIDNGWASAPDWDKRVATAGRLINDAEKKEMPIILAFTSEKANQDIGPYGAGEARSRLNAVRPRPVPVDREGVFLAVANTIGDKAGVTLAMLTDGLAAKDDAKAFAPLLERKLANIVWATPDRLDMVGLTTADNGLDRFSVTAVRAPSGATPRFMTAGAFDEKGRRIGDAAITFRPGETTASGEIVVPFELRNDFASIALDGENQAAGVRLLDGTAKRRRVGLLSQAPTDDTRQLLSPLYYIRRALEPSADIIEPKSPDLLQAIPELLEQKPAVIVMGDVGTVPEATRAPLIKWMQNGGTLVRFASTRLLTAGNDEDLLPVKLRLGERQLGGTLSWTEPQKVTEFPPNGPFAKLAPPQDVTVTRQILAEPTPTLAERTWATLADGTPLVTADRRGKGIVVLFHITPAATWSNLPISGSFVEMLRAIVQLSRNQGAAGSAESGPAASLPPYRMIAADGQIEPPGGDAKPLQTGKGPLAVTIENPPGLYGTEDSVFAHNLLTADAALTPISRPTTSVPIVAESYAVDESRDMKGPLLFGALALLILDGLIVLWLAGLWRRNARRITAAVLALIVLPALFLQAPPASANDAKPDDPQAIEATSVTRLAYVLTGNSSIDSVSRAGMTGLTRFLREKTALEPGEPTGVNVESDDLAFYPLIYWPVDANVPTPSQAAIARIDEYMKNGGTILFDTRDQYAASIETSTSPATLRLREILGSLNVPPLEPVPSDHVLTKSFYILNDFPGRFAGSPLWVEASLEAANPDNRPVRTGDGVTPIMITANDFAGAWAVDGSGSPLLPTVPSDPMQRELAFRSGVNIMMYMLTGNYKSDQVHVPDLLQRLGQ